MKTLKTLVTTGENLVEDVLMFAECQHCFDAGQIEIRDADGQPTGRYLPCHCRL